jgi:Thioredoxin-like
MRVRWLGLLLLAVAGPACGKSRSSEPEIAWFTHVDAACRAASEQHKPLLFFYAATWDVATSALEHRVFVDPEIRRIVRRDYVPLRVDRTNTWMQEDDAPRDELREVEEATRRFHPYASKYATVSVTGADCATEVHRFDALFEPRAFAAQLKSAAARAR